MNKELNGITIEGKSVEDYLTGETTKQIGQAMHEKHYAKRRGKVRYMDRKENSGEVESTRHKILARLLNHIRVTSEDVVRNYGIKNRTAAAGLLRSIYTSEFGDLYMKRTGNIKKGYRYYVPETIDDTGVRFSDINMDIDLAYKLSCQKKPKKEKSKITTGSDLKSKSVEVPAASIKAQDIDVNINVRVTFSFEIGGING